MAISEQFYAKNNILLNYGEFVEQSADQKTKLPFSQL